MKRAAAAIAASILVLLLMGVYQVFFDPDAYPMNWAWWDGQVPLDHYRAEHALDLEAVLETRTRAEVPKKSSLGTDSTESPEQGEK